MFVKSRMLYKIVNSVLFAKNSIDCRYADLCCQFDLIKYLILSKFRNLMLLVWLFSSERQVFLLIDGQLDSVKLCEMDQ